MAPRTATSIAQQAHRLFELIDVMDVAGMTAMMTLLGAKPEGATFTLTAVAGEQAIEVPYHLD